MSSKDDEPSLSYGDTVHITIESVPDVHRSPISPPVFQIGLVFTEFVDIVDIHLDRRTIISKDGKFDDVRKTITYSLSNFSIKAIRDVYLRESYGKFELVWNPYPSELDDIVWKCSVT